VVRWSGSGQWSGEMVRQWAVGSGVVRLSGNGLLSGEIFRQWAVEW
jgi:hypothetical protein